MKKTQDFAFAEQRVKAHEADALEDRTEVIKGCLVHGSQAGLRLCAGTRRSSESFKPKVETVRSLGKTRKNHLRSRGFHLIQTAGSVSLFLVAAALLWQKSNKAWFGIQLNNWPMRSTAWVVAHKPRGPVYHTFTFGGYLVYWLKGYKVFGDTREYCFKHLEARYHDAYMNPQALQETLDEYDVMTSISKIPMTEKMPNGEYFAVKDKFMGAAWARVYFDHVSEVLVCRDIPDHAQLIKENEIIYLNPAFPPDAHTRVILGREGTKEKRVRLILELDHCLKQPYVELYCHLIHILNLSGGTSVSHAELHRWFDFLDGFNSHSLNHERIMVRQYVNAVKIHLHTKLNIAKPLHLAT